MAVPETQAPQQAPAEAQNAPAKLSSEPKKKLLGRELYKSLGSPKYIVAPMVDRSEFAWRMLTRSFMPSDSPTPLLSYSPMYHARMFGENAGYRDSCFRPTRAENGDENNTPYLDGNPSIDRPLFVQFCTNNPDEFLEASKHVAPYCDAVDLNLGCPQGIARKGHYGAFLQEDWDLIYKLINRLHNELPVPVTAKFRIQETKEKTLEYAKMILSAGASIITLHGRTIEQKGHNTGIADWSYIRYLRDNLPPDTVIFANGNILSHDDLERCLEETGADGVMSAECNLSDPSVFSKPPAEGTHGREYWRGRDGRGGYRIDAVFRRYLDIVYKYVLEQPAPERKPLYLPSDPEQPELEADTFAEEEGEGPPKKRLKRERNKRPASPSLAVMQGHLFQLLRPMISVHTNVRNALAASRPGDMASFERVLSLTEKAVKAGLDEYEEHPERFETPADAELKGSKVTIAEYGRPFWVCQPHIRPLPEEAMELGALTAKKKGKGKENKPAADEEPSDKEKIPDTKGTATPSDKPVEPDSATATPDRLVSG